MTIFNAQSARAKRPCPLWVDAFQRDTQHLEADEVGAYMLILMAMWTRETCDFPDQDNRLARVSRVSTRLWKSRIGPSIRPFLESSAGMLISSRLRKEAAYVERVVTQQSDRKKGEKRDKPLKNNDAYQTTDTSTDEPRDHPTQQPKYPTEEDKSSSLAAAEYQDYLKAHPKAVESAKGEAAFSALLADGVDARQIVAAAIGYADHVKDWSAEAKVQQSDNFLSGEYGKWRDYIPKPKAAPPTRQQILQAKADAINGDGFIPASFVTPSQARQLIDAGLVTQEQMSKQGIAA